MQYKSRKEFEILRGQLELERSSFISHYKDLGDYILSRRPRFYTSDVNKGDRRNQKIIDSTATLSARTLRSGMMGGVTSPARPWFRLAVPDPTLAEAEAVKQWLHLVTSRMNTVFIRSNLYNTLPIIYGDMGVFATAAMLVEEDFDTVIRTTAIPIGSYCIANSERGKVEVFSRSFKMTVSQIVEKFGRQDNGEIDWSNISTTVKSLFENKQLQSWVEVCHIILPNNYFDPSRAKAKFKKYRSVYYEKGVCSGSTSNYMGRSEDEQKLLRESGYDYFPVLAPRWETTGEDVYGSSCPGMDALGDIKQLQLGEKRIMQAIDLVNKPPMKAPIALQFTKSSILPGDVTYIDEINEQKSFSPIYQIDPRIRELEEKQQQVRQRISRVFYEDLFLMLANTDRREITAREIEERHEEKLLALGPVLEQLNQDLLDPLIDITFDFMNAQGLIPPPPEEIQGAPLRVEYISIMAQAQKLAGIGGIERFAQFTNQLVATVPDTVHKVDFDQMLDVYGDILSLAPGIIRSDEEAQAIRSQIQQAQQAQMQSEQIAQDARAAKDLSQTDLEGDSALSRLLRQSQAGQAVGQ